MPVWPEATPNPNAVKFTVGRQVGGPKTFAAGQETDDPLALALLAIGGVVAVFMSADFVTLTKDPAAEWSDIAPQAQLILESEFPED
ncbi:MAG TPA: NifU N-terminal domain-containing protein [Acidimicrobiia bacterium]|jgi:hypothetical protein